MGSFSQQTGELVALSETILLLLIISMASCEWLVVVSLVFNLYAVEMAILASGGRSYAKLT